MILFRKPNTCAFAIGSPRSSRIAFRNCIIQMDASTAMVFPVKASKLTRSADGSRIVHRSFTPIFLQLHVQFQVSRIFFFF